MKSLRIFLIFATFFSLGTPSLCSNTNTAMPIACLPGALGSGVAASMAGLFSKICGIKATTEGLDNPWSDYANHLLKEMLTWPLLKSLLLENKIIPDFAKENGVFMQLLQRNGLNAEQAAAVAKQWTGGWFKIGGKLAAIMKDASKARAFLGKFCQRVRMSIVACGGALYLANLGARSATEKIVNKCIDKGQNPFLNQFIQVSAGFGWLQLMKKLFVFLAPIVCVSAMNEKENEEFLSSQEEYEDFEKDAHKATEWTSNLIEVAVEGGKLAGQLTFA